MLLFLKVNKVPISCDDGDIESTFTELTSQMIPHILSQSFKTDIAHIQETEVDDAHRFEVTGFTASPSEHYSYWLGNYDEDDDEDDEGEEL